MAEGCIEAPNSEADTIMAATDQAGAQAQTWALANGLGPMNEASAIEARNQSLAAGIPTDTGVNSAPISPLTLEQQQAQYDAWNSMRGHSLASSDTGIAPPITVTAVGGNGAWQVSGQFAAALGYSPTDPDYENYRYKAQDALVASGQLVYSSKSNNYPVVPGQQFTLSSDAIENGSIGNTINALNTIQVSQNAAAVSLASMPAGIAGLSNLNQATTVDQNFQIEGMRAAAVATAPLEVGLGLQMTPPMAQPVDEGKSVLDKFLDGYEHAGDSPIAQKAIAFGSAIEGIKTVVEMPDNLTLLGEDAIGAAQAYGAGWVQGGNILARSATLGGLSMTLLDGLALEGAVQVGKITAGVTNIYNDAY
jgi:hypothetical protein